MTKITIRKVHQFSPNFTIILEGFTYAFIPFYRAYLPAVSRLKFLRETKA